MSVRRESAHTYVKHTPADVGPFALSSRGGASESGPHFRSVTVFNIIPFACIKSAAPRTRPCPLTAGLVFVLGPPNTHNYKLWRNLLTWPSLCVIPDSPSEELNLLSEELAAAPALPPLCPSGVLSALLCSAAAEEASCVFFFQLYFIVPDFFVLFCFLYHDNNLWLCSGGLLGCGVWGSGSSPAPSRPPTATGSVAAVAEQGRT